MAKEPTRSTLCDLETPEETYYAEATHHLNNYIWKIEDPPIDAKLWKMMGPDAAEYFQSVKIRDNAVSTGG